MIINRREAKDRLDEWIADIVPGRSFIDIGGIGEFATNERCTFALNAGASRSAMADFEPYGHHLWEHYLQELRGAGIGGVETFERANLDDPELADRLGRWDVVHSTGILYHVPNPAHTILNVKRLVRKYLILNTVVLPHRIENLHGSFELPQAGVALFAALGGTERRVLRHYYEETLKVPIDVVAPQRAPGAMMPYMLGSQPSYYPWWWIFTPHSFEALLGTLDMKVLDRDTWRDHVHAVLLERV